jgi:DNA/RNA-binding domain of Phe-tRNA-synthetase-like protein
MQIAVEPHPTLDVRAFITRFPSALGTTLSPEWLVTLLSATAEAPVRADDQLRGTIRDLLRHGGYKPTGRGKPASEYLVRAAREGALRSINLAVDVCNAVSLHSGLPVSLIDLDRAEPPFRIALGGPGEQYVFNASGQVIDVTGLVCLFDRLGPCANAVKDSERTKTTATTRNSLTVIWSSTELGAATDAALRFYHDLLGRAGAAVELVETA